MISGIHSLIDASLVQQLRFDNIANNLANINTTAFKRDTISFNQILNMNNDSRTDFTPGLIRFTGNKLDLALEGPGFFQIQTPRGIRYTKNGSFILDKQGFLITQSGDRVLGQNGPVRIEGGDISIQGDGNILADNRPVDKLLVVDFKQAQLLTKEGGSCFTYLGEKKDIFPAENINVQQGYLERSNVNPTEEMIRMVESLRAFESAQKAIQAMDELTNKMVNDPGLL